MPSFSVVHWRLESVSSTVLVWPYSQGSGQTRCTSMTCDLAHGSKSTPATVASTVSVRSTIA